MRMWCIFAPALAALLAGGMVAIVLRRPRITPPLQFSNKDFAKLEQCLIWAEEKCHHVARLEDGHSAPRTGVTAKWTAEAEAVHELRGRVALAWDKQAAEVCGLPLR